MIKIHSGKQKIAVCVLGTVIIAGGSFYAGMKYGQNTPVGRSGMDTFANLSPEERATRTQQFGGGRGGVRGGGGFTAGEIIAKDATSITVKLGANGGSKIIFISGSTQILKSAAGSADDLAVGEQIIASGTPNTDGSMNAQSVQVRPTLSTPHQAK